MGGWATTAQKFNELPSTHFCAKLLRMGGWAFSENLVLAAHPSIHYTKLLRMCNRSTKLRRNAHPPIRPLLPNLVTDGRMGKRSTKLRRNAHPPIRPSVGVDGRMSKRSTKLRRNAHPLIHPNVSVDGRMGKRSTKLRRNAHPPIHPNVSVDGRMGAHSQRGWADGKFL